MRTYYFLILLALLGCNKVPRFQYYDCQGNKIDNSINMDFVKNEMDSLENLFHFRYKTYHVYTSLNNDIAISLDAFIEKFRDSLVNNLKNEKKIDQHMLDSIDQIKELFEFAVVVMENKTGRILLYYNSPIKVDQIQKKYALGSMSKSYVFARAMEEGFSPHDFFPSTKTSFKDSNRILIPDTPYHYTFAQVFSISLPMSLISLDYRYHISDFVSLIENFDCQVENKDASLPALFEMSLFDIAKSHMVFKNNGNLLSPIIIDSILDQNKQIIYRSESHYKKVIEDSTAFKMMELLEFYVNGKSARGLSIRGKYHYYKDIGARFGEYGSLGTNRCLVVSENITYGIITHCNYPMMKFPFINWNANKTTLPIWFELTKLMEE